jgi:hypothetical protein
MGPSAKNQLANLVVKLDQLTKKPLAVTLDDEQRKKLAKQLDGLDKKEELSDEEAKKRLQAVLEIVKGDKKTLQSAGYRWPGEQGGGAGGFRPPQDVPNPFTEEENNEHLKSLQKQLAKPK